MARQELYRSPERPGRFERADPVPTEASVVAPRQPTLSELVAAQVRIQLQGARFPLEDDDGEDLHAPFPEETEIWSPYQVAALAEAETLDEALAERLASPSPAEGSTQAPEDVRSGDAPAAEPSAPPVSDEASEA